uniref:RNA-directed DNA polymerase, eukaryota, reverse transcriptase zinc-binding domain protein n=1 Tax=Tanacetum cinerariifolium TaxID=118510 RepID=A0A6L2JGG9_TANCI|nr:RNA-directed DNA polymerase, eukaryota, reverse transcriptase zinc-binding domain protein [Tanacetum cinerariifolium]
MSAKFFYIFLSLRACCGSLSSSEADSDGGDIFKSISAAVHSKTFGESSVADSVGNMTVEEYHRVCDMRHASALDFASLESQISAILAAIEVEIEHLLDEGESIFLGDFNEVRSKQERFGTSFNALGANAFNSFISMAGLVDLPLDGYKYTWLHKSSSKISKLDRLADVDKILDQGNGSDDIVNERKRSQIAIRGVLVEGDWIDEPSIISFEQHRDLEIKCAVWDCGSNKSLGPDGFTFDFYHRYWKLIDQDVVNVISEFFSSGLYKGIQVDESLTLSHLFYADDSVFIGKWDKSNINVIVSVLKCFFLASGLKINLHKSKLMGINIPQEDVSMAANSTGCTTLTVPFNYLSVKALLFKWVWRFITNDSSLWYRCIKAIYGDRGALDSSGILARRSPWTDIIREFHSLSSKGINLHAFVKKKVGDGEKTLFWEDSWLSDPPLKNIFPRLYTLETNKHASVAAKFRDTSMSASFRRVPRGGLEEEQFQLLVDKLHLLFFLVSKIDGFGPLILGVSSRLSRHAHILMITYCRLLGLPRDG